MQIAHKVELKANNKQVTYFQKGCGISRFAWNWALAEWNKQYNHNLQLPPESRCKISGLSLKKQFNSLKKQEFPWTGEVTKYAAQQPFIQLNTAFQRFFKKLAGRPNFKKKNKSADSFYIGGDQLKFQHKKIWIPNLGFVRMKENLRFEGKINSATISKKGERWFASIQIEVDDKAFEQCQSSKSVGVDLGIHKMVVLSDTSAVDSPRPLQKNLRKLKRQQKILSKKICSAKKDGRLLKDSKNFQKQKIKVSKTYAIVSNVRKDTTQKITSYLTKNFRHIAIEDLNVKGMVKNHNLARAILDIGFGELRRQLEYKSKMRGNNLVVADRFYPSSKSCSRCQKVKKDLSLSERVFSCECGLRLDRDLNASINLENLIEFKVRPVRSELTPVEMTAMQRSVFPIQVTSIVESGSKLQTG